MKKKLATIFGLSMGTIALATSAIAGSIALTSCTSSDFGLVPLNAGLDSVSSIVQNQINALYDTLDTNARSAASAAVTTDGKTTTLDAATPVVKISDLIAATQEANFQTQFIQSAVDAINANPDNTPVLSNNPLSTNDITKVSFDIWANKQSGFSVVCNMEFNNNIMLSQPDITSSNYSITSQRSISMNPITFDKAVAAPTPEVEDTQLIGVNNCLNGLYYLNASVFGSAIRSLTGSGLATVDNITAMMTSSAFQSTWKMLAVNTMKIYQNVANPDNATQDEKLVDYIWDDVPNMNYNIMNSDLNVDDFKSVKFNLITDQNKNWGIETNIVFSDRVFVGVPIKGPIRGAAHYVFNRTDIHSVKIVMVSSMSQDLPSCDGVLINTPPLPADTINAMFNAVADNVKNLYATDPDQALDINYLNGTKKYQPIIKKVVEDAVAKTTPDFNFPKDSVVGVKFTIDNSDPSNPTFTPEIRLDPNKVNVTYESTPREYQIRRASGNVVLSPKNPIPFK